MHGSTNHQRLSATLSGKAAGRLAVVHGSTNHHCSSTVAREVESVRENGGERRIKYEIVGIEYRIEITRVRKK
jgi:hypothetical protein